MDANYLLNEINSMVQQWNSVFDDIGLADHERQAREAELFTAVSETLTTQIRQVDSERTRLYEEAKQTITAIHQMEASLDDNRSLGKQPTEELVVTYPLLQCIKSLRERHQQMMRLYQDRFEQVEKLADALESYSSHLEPSFVNIPLPPSTPSGVGAPMFDISSGYINKLDQEFTRVYDEYNRRLQTVHNICEQIINLWAELGVPQGQTDPNIVKYYRDAPEQLGLHQEDIHRLAQTHEKLSNEKNAREKHLADLRASVENMWSMLGVDEAERKAFLNANRGCGMRQINEYEDEVARLTELKHQNLHIFVEDARTKLQELWDAMYFSEDEMLEFTPAFSDVYSDALLEAHEREMARLQRLREQRAPTLAIVDKHRDLTAQKKELEQSSQDASRLMMKPQKGERRDPGKLLREEKMRKRIAKELPRVVVEVRKALEKYEEEFGVPFTVHGERYLDFVEEEDSGSSSRRGGTARPKTPGGPVMPNNTGNASAAKPAGGLNKARSVGNLKNAAAAQGPNRALNRSPVAGQKAMPTPRPASTAPGSLGRSRPGSPTRLPARTPLSNLQKNGNTSPGRPKSPQRSPTRAGGTTLIRAPPPKMREAPKLETPVNTYKSAGLHEQSNARQADNDDVFGPTLSTTPMMSSSQFNTARFNGANKSQSSNTVILSNAMHGSNMNSTYVSTSSADSSRPESMLGFGVRHVSGASTNISNTSENWETYGDGNSEPEPDASDMYLAKLRAARGKRFGEETATMAQDHVMRLDGNGAVPSSDSGTSREGRTYSNSSHSSNGGMTQRIRGVVAPMTVGQATLQTENHGQRLPTDVEWTDEDVL